MCVYISYHIISYHVYFLLPPSNCFFSEVAGLRTVYSHYSNALHHARKLLPALWRCFVKHLSVLRVRLCKELFLHVPFPAQELDHPEFGHYFVKRALTTALDKHDREREMTAVLLSALYNEVRRLRHGS